MKGVSRTKNGRSARKNQTKCENLNKKYPDLPRVLLVFRFIFIIFFFTLLVFYFEFLFYFCFALVSPPVGLCWMVW